MKGARQSLRAAALAVALAGATACEEPPLRSQVMVVIDADEGVKAEIRDVDLFVRSGTGPNPQDWTPRYEKTLTDGGPIAWPLEVALVPRANQTGGNFEVEATARGAGGVVAQVRAISGYVDGRSLALPLRFDAECVADTKICPAGETCEQGGCVDARKAPEDLPRFERPDEEAADPPADGEMNGDPPAGGDDAMGDEPSDGDPPVESGPLDGGAEMDARPAVDARSPGGDDGGTTGHDAEVEPVPSCESEEDCAGCPEGLRKHGDRCMPALLGLEVSVGQLTPALDADVTRYDLAVPLVSNRVTLKPRVAGDVTISVGGTELSSGDSYESAPLPLGGSTLTLALTHPVHGARLYTIALERAGTQRAYLKAHNTGAGDGFGCAVALSGDTIAVGARYEDSSGPAGSDNASTESGGVYVFSRSDDSYVQRAFLKAEPVRAGAMFGWAVALLGDTLVVGAPEESGDGALHVFEQRDGEWQHQARLTRSVDTREEALFGRSLWLGEDLLIAGAPGETNSRGAVYVFQRRDGRWGTGTRVAPDLSQRGSFGTSIACNASRCAVGATTSTSGGETFIYELSGGQLRETSRLSPPASVREPYFGESVAMGRDWLAVGAFGPSFDNSTGIVQMFHLEADRWVPGQPLISSNPSTLAAFGTRVVSVGDVLLVSATNEDGGRGGVNPPSDGTTVRDSGAVYLFERSGHDFRQLARVKADVPSRSASYGFALAADATTLVIGADQESSAATGVDGDATDEGAPESGAAYVLR